MTTSHYKQFDHYFYFDGKEHDADRLRYREDDYLSEDGKVLKTQTRLTLLGTTARQEFPNAVMLSRSRFLAAADRSLRFYNEYFAPASILEVVKERYRWRIKYQETELVVNIDKLLQPKVGNYYLEIKARTWSRKDAEQKTNIIAQLLALLEVDLNQAEKLEYAEIAASLT